MESLRIKQNRYIEFLDKIAFISFCVLLVDCTISGGGRWLIIGPLSMRMIAGLIAAVCALPGFLSRYKEWIKNPVIISLAVLIVYLGVCAYRGIISGNRTDVLLRDISGFAWLFLIPVAMTIATERRYDTILKCILWGSLLQALLVIALNIVCLIENDLNQPINALLIGNQIGNIDYIAPNLFRIFTKSSPYLIVGIIIMVYMQIRSKRFNWLYAIASGISLCALLLTYTRSIYGAAFVSIPSAVILYFVCAKNLRRKILLHIVAAVLGAFVFTMVQQAAAGENFFQFAVNRVFSQSYVHTELSDNTAGDDIESFADRPAQLAVTQATYSGDRQKANLAMPRFTQLSVTDAEQGPVEHDLDDPKFPDKQQYIEDTKNSDDLRNITLEELRVMIGNNPVFGNGLGASISYREDGLVEYFYYDILNKTGVVGLVLYCFPFCYMVCMLFRWRKNESRVLLQAMVPLCGLLAFFAASYYNPYMNAVLGISLYSVSIGSIYRIHMDMTRLKELNQFADERTDINAAL